MVVGGLHRESQEYLQTHHTDGGGEQSLGREEGPGPQAHRMNQNPEEEKKNYVKEAVISGSIQSGINYFFYLK